MEPKIAISLYDTKHDLYYYSNYYICLIHNIIIFNNFLLTRQTLKRLLFLIFLVLVREQKSVSVSKPVQSPTHRRRRWYPHHRF
jgi:hypothetical protein